MFKRGFLGKARLAHAVPQLPGATPAQIWWMHHIINTRAYAEHTLAGETPGALEALRELWTAVKEWEGMTKSWAAGVLMAEHTALAKLFVDCLSMGGGDCAGVADEALGRNVEAHRQLFPAQPERFAELFGLHTKLAGQYISDLADGRRRISR